MSALLLSSNYERESCDIAFQLHDGIRETVSLFNNGLYEKDSTYMQSHNAFSLKSIVDLLIILRGRRQRTISQTIDKKSIDMFKPERL